jgi:hypothetical protein
LLCNLSRWKGESGNSILGIVVAPERRRIEKYEQRECSKRFVWTCGISKGAKRQTVELDQVVPIQKH